MLVKSVVVSAALHIGVIYLFLMVAEVTENCFFFGVLHVLMKPVDEFGRTPVTSHCYLMGILVGIVCNELEFNRM